MSSPEADVLLRVDGSPVALAWRSATEVVVATSEGHVHLVGRERAVRTEHVAHDGSMAHALCPRGRGLAWVSPRGRPHLARLDGDGWGAARELWLPTGARASCVAWSSDGARLAIGAGATLLCYDAAGEVVGRDTARAGTIGALAFAPRTSELAVSTSLGTYVLPPDDTRAARFFEHAAAPVLSQWSPDGRTLAVALHDSTLAVLRPAHEDATIARGAVAGGYERRIRSLAFSPDSALLATSGARAVVVWDLASGGPLGTSPILIAGHDELVSVVAFVPDAAMLLSGSRDGAIAVSTADTLGHSEGPRAAHLAFMPSDPVALVVGPDGGDLAIADLEGHIALI